MDIDWIDCGYWLLLYSLSAVICSVAGYLMQRGFKKWGNEDSVYAWMWITLLFGGVFGWMTFAWFNRKEID